MPVINITPAQLGPVMQAVGAAVAKAMDEAAFEAAQRGRSLIVSRIIPMSRKMPVDTGFYRQSWKAERLPGGGAILFSDAPYAAVIEHGRRVGQRPPPVNVIAAWVRRKMGRRLKREIRRRYAGQRLAAGDREAAIEREIQSTAFVIARAIGRRGLPPQWVMARALPSVRRLFQESVQRRLAQIR